MAELKWDLIDIIWNTLLPKTLEIGRRDLTPQRINQESADDLRAFLQVFTGMPFCNPPTLTADDAVITTSHPSGLPRGTYYYQFTAVTDFDTENDFIENRMIVYGNGTVGPYLKTLSKSIKPGTLTITDGTETFTDDGAGLLIGDKGGTGSVNYNGGDIAVTFNNPTEAAIVAFYVERKTGETPPGVVIKIYLNYDNSRVTWNFENRFCVGADRFKVYRADRFGYGMYPYGAYPYGRIIMTDFALRYDSPSAATFPEFWVDDGSDPAFLATAHPPTKNTAQYESDILDQSITLDEMRNKIRRMPDLLDPDEIPEQLLEHLFYELAMRFDKTADVTEQVEEYKKKIHVYKIKSTIPSYERVLRRHGDEKATIYTPHLDIMRYSHSALSGGKLSATRGIISFSKNGKVYIDTTGYAVLEELVATPFSEAREGDLIKMNNEGGPKDGFVVTKVVSDQKVEIVQATVLFKDPRHRGKTEIDVEYYHVIPGADVDYLSNWVYYHHGVYEINSYLNPNLYKDEIKRDLHPTGTRIWFVYRIESLICSDDGVPASPSDHVVIVSQVTKGATAFDEITEPWRKSIKTVVAINKGGIWNATTGSFDGGTEYTEGWSLVKDFTDMMNPVYSINWDTGAPVEPAMGEDYWVAFIDCRMSLLELKEAEMQMIIHPSLKNTPCGMTFSVSPGMSMNFASWSGCIQIQSKIVLQIDASWPPRPQVMTVEKGVAGGFDLLLQPIGLKMKRVIAVNRGGLYIPHEERFEGGITYTEGVHFSVDSDETTFPSVYRINWVAIADQPLETYAYYVAYEVDEWLPVPMRRVPHFTYNLKLYDLYGTVGYLAPVLPQTTEPGDVWWSNDDYRWNDRILYMDAQPPHVIEGVVYTGLSNPSLSKDAADTMDEFVPPSVKRVTSIVQVNQLGSWDNSSASFLGGTDYAAGTDWLFYVDDSVFPNRFYVDWSPGGVEPAPLSSYNIAYTLEE